MAGAYWSGRVGSCFWSCVVGPYDDDDVDAFVAGIHRIGESRLSDIVVLDVTYDIGLPKATQRRKLADAVAAQPNMKRVGAHAVVCNAPVARAVVTAVNWFVRPVFPESMFSEPRAALRWVKQTVPSVDEQAVLSELAATVPRFNTLRW